MAELCYETINRSPFITPDFEADLPVQLAAAAAAGFSWIGLDLASIEQYCDRGGSLEALREALDAHGLRCFELQPLIVSQDAVATRGQADRFAEAARVLGAPWIQCGLAARSAVGTVESFRIAAEIVGEQGAKLAVEYLPFAPIRSIAETRAFLSEAGATNAGIVVDCWHYFHGPEDWDALESLSLEELAYPQFNDHPALESDDLMFETTQRRVLPGQGRFDLERFVRTLRAIGYDGVVSVEILSQTMRAWEPARFAKEVFQSAQRFWPQS